MSRVLTDNGFVEMKKKTGSGHHRAVWRNWHFVKAHGAGGAGRVVLGVVYFPKSFTGKKVKFRCEIMEDIPK